MDFVKNFTGGDKDNGAATQQNQQRREGEPAQENKEEGGFLSGIGNKLNSAAGGGKESEKNEDYLDKGMPSSPLNLRLPELGPALWSCPIMKSWSGEGRTRQQNRGIMMSEHG